MTTALMDSASKRYIFGLHRYIDKAEDAGLLYERRVVDYEPVFRVPSIKVVRRCI